jgi:hypothetical protein
VRVLVSSMTIEEIFTERELFKRRIHKNIQTELVRPSLPFPYTTNWVPPGPGELSLTFFFSGSIRSSHLQCQRQGYKRSPHCPAPVSAPAPAPPRTSPSWYRRLTMSLELRDAPDSFYFESLSRKAHEGAINQARIGACYHGFQPHSIRVPDGPTTYKYENP